MKAKFQRKEGWNEPAKPEKPEDGLFLIQNDMMNGAGHSLKTLIQSLKNVKPKNVLDKMWEAVQIRGSSRRCGSWTKKWICWPGVFPQRDGLQVRAGSIPVCPVLLPVWINHLCRSLFILMFRLIFNWWNWFLERPCQCYCAGTQYVHFSTSDLMHIMQIDWLHTWNDECCTGCTGSPSTWTDSNETFWSEFTQIPVNA